MMAIRTSQLCNAGDFFQYADSSTQLPQGPLYYFFECLLGTIGLTDFLSILTIEIIISQILIFSSYFIFKNYFNNKKLIYAILIFSLNPYLIVSSRNLSTHYHQELFLILFFYFLISQKNKLHYFLLGFICTLSFSAYHLLSVFLSTLLFFVFLFKKIQINKELILGLFVGLLASTLLYLPFIFNNQITGSIFRNTSWGLSSYWRILLNFLSGKSIVNKVNHVNNFESLIESFEYFKISLNLTYGLIVFLTIFAVLKVFSVKDFSLLNIIGIHIIFTFGILLTILNVALYPHYYFSMFIFGYLFILYQINSDTLINLVLIVFIIGSSLSYENFSNYIDQNNGAHLSDYGKSYNICGCCVEDARTCRGQ